jgi:ribosomal-protein-alanine N-acetyltransferase
MPDDRGLPLAASAVPVPPPVDTVGRLDVPAQAAAGIEIGPVRFRDLRAVARLQRRAFQPRLAYGPLTLLLLWALPNVRFLVARRVDRVVGCAIGDRHDGQSRVINLAVAPDARRKGIGAALLDALESALPGGDLLLMVEEENLPARALYERAGYAQVGVARDYYGRGRHGMWMQKRRTSGESGPRKVRT